jgi:hypothetical protein
MAFGVSFSPSGDYIAIAFDAAPKFTLLNHTTPGTLTLAATYALGGFTRHFSWFFTKWKLHWCGFVWQSTYFTLLDHTTPGSVSP